MSISKSSPSYLAKSNVHGLRAGGFMASLVLPLAHTLEHEEFLEFLRLEGHGVSHDEVLLARDMYLLQLCSGVDENASGACAQLVFAPIDESFADDAPLLPSGFRVIPLDTKTVNSFDQCSYDRAGTLSEETCTILHRATSTSTSLCSLIDSPPVQDSSKQGFPRFSMIDRE